MSSRPAEIEATGAQWFVAEHRGRDFKLPADVEGWPLELIGNSVGTRGGKVAVDHQAVTAALAELLGADQWEMLLEAFPRRRDLVPISRSLAAAAGFEGRPGDLAWGALPRLLGTLEAHCAAVEATLAMTGTDYRDRWRFDGNGERRLTLRRIYVLLEHMPFDSPLAIVENGGRRPLGPAELLLMDVFEAVARKRHPSRPMSKEQVAERATAIDNFDKERAAYRARTAAGTRRLHAVQTARAAARGEGNGSA